MTVGIICNIKLHPQLIKTYGSCVVHYLKLFVCMSLNTKMYHQYLFSQFIPMKTAQNVGTNIFVHKDPTLTTTTTSQ
jgi:hypothetical protein